MSRRKLVLVIDDDEALLRVLSRRLKRGGFEVLTANDPLEGLQQAEEQSPAAVLTDAVMPQMHGFEVARGVLELGRGIQVVMMTGCVEPINVIDAYKMGVSDFIIKGSAHDGLIEIITQACGRQEGWRSLVREAFKGRPAAG